MTSASAARRAPLGTAEVPPEVAERLAARLRRETQGEVLFDAGSRGRYATDASIYQIMPAGVFVPKNGTDVATAICLARDLHVPVLARGAGDQSVRPEDGRGLGHAAGPTSAAAWFKSRGPD